LEFWSSKRPYDKHKFCFCFCLLTKESDNLVTRELNKASSAANSWIAKITQLSICWDCLALLWPWHL
jgi:hypothetical protein